jgi:hypothetical protein
VRRNLPSLHPLGRLLETNYRAAARHVVAQSRVGACPVAAALRQPWSPSAPLLQRSAEQLPCAVRVGVAAKQVLPDLAGVLRP